MQSFDENDDEDGDDHAPLLLPAPEPADTTSLRRVWVGLIVTGIVFVPVYSPLRLLYPPVERWLQVRTFYEEVACETLFQWVRAACVFLLMLWDGAPLGVFGLKKPMWSVDSITSCIVFAAQWTLGLMTVDLFADLELQHPKAAANLLCQRL